MHKKSNIRSVNNYMHIDVKLLKACAKNKRKAQEELYKACFLFLMPICKRYHKNNEDAHAAYNDVFLKILDNLSKLDLDTVPFASWAKRVMTNALIDEYRRNRKYREQIQKCDEERTLEFFSRGVSNEAITNYNENSVLRLLEYLKPDSKRVFILYVIEGYSHKEISDIMDMSVGTSKWHLSTARKELREMITKVENKNLNNLAI